MALFDSDIVLLTGAGASIPVDIPGMVGMVQQFKTTHGKSDPARRAYESLVRMGVAEDLEEVLQFCNRLIELRESVLMTALMDAVGPRGGSGVNEFDRRIFDQIASAELLRDSLVEWIGDVCLSFDREKAAEIYGDLVASLAARKIPVFTTNYDGVLDEVAASKKIPVADNFMRDARGRSFWDPTYRSFSNPGLRIVKLHGAIYWHATVGNAVIEKIMQPAPRNAEGEELSQLLIFPTRFKDIYQQNYFPLYSAFIQALGRATTLILIGHSLRDEYLHAAVRERLKDESFGLVVVDVELPDAVRTLGGRALHLEGGIEKFAPILSQAIAEHGRSDKVFDYLQEAKSAIKRGRKAKITVTGLPASALAGQLIKGMVLSLDTLLGAHTWGAFILVDGNRQPLATDPEARRVQGFGSKSVTLRLRIPKDIQPGQRYEISFVLFDEGGQQVAQVVRSLRVKQA